MASIVGIKSWQRTAMFVTRSTHEGRKLLGVALHGLPLAAESFLRQPSCFGSGKAHTAKLVYIPEAHLYERKTLAFNNTLDKVARCARQG